MLTVKELNAKVMELSASIEAIAKLAEEEKRELTPEEIIEADRLLAAKDLIVNEQLPRAIKLETCRAEALARFQGNADRREQTATGRETRVIIVPARAKVHGRLKAFIGEDAEQNAYVAGRWLAANFLGHSKSKAWLKEHGIRNAMSESEDDRGGIFVPTEMSTTIIRLVEEFGIFRQFASNEPMGSDSKTIPVRVSGLTATPVGETTRANEGSNKVTAQDITYTVVELIARKWKVVVKMSDELNEDALISMADQVSMEAALAFAYAEDNAGFNGDGTSAYHSITGIINAVLAGSIFTAAAGHTAFSTLTMSDFESMVGKLPDYKGINPSWFISKAGYYASMHRLTMAAGGNTAENLQNGGRPVFLGYPVVISQVLNKTLAAQTSTRGLLAFGDLNMGVKFGDRRRVTMSVADQAFWEEDQIAIKATERFDINVHSTGTATAAGAVLILSTPGA